MKRYALAGIVAASFGLAGCAKYEPGDCLQHVHDGHVWRITYYSWSDGYSAQGWLNGKWGIPVGRQPRFNFDSAGYVKVACPFSTEIIKPPDR
jgi:hypothetical protein